MSDFITTFRDWLPTGRFRFVGGPADGQTLPVNMVETLRGMTAPGIWRVEERPKSSALMVRPSSVAAPDMQSPVRIHTYRFIPTSHWNEGYYLSEDESDD